MSARIAGRLVTAVCVVAGCVGLLPSVAGADVGVVFGSSQLIDSAAPFGSPFTVAALACAPGSSDCAALGQTSGTGIQETTTSDAGGTATPTWTTPGGTGLASLTELHMTCPSTTLCVAVGAGPDPASGAATNEAVVSTDGGTTWSAPVALEPNSASDSMRSIGCTTNGECVATDSEGNAFYGDAADGGAWQVESLTTDFPVTVPVPAVACSGTDICVVTVDAAGAIAFLVATDVGAGTAPTWTLNTTTDTSGTPEAIACAPDGAACVATDSAGNALISAGPSFSTWSVVSTTDKNPLQAVSCPSADECVMADAAADKSVVATSLSTSPTFATVSTPAGASPLSCPSVSWCVGGTGLTVSYGQVNTVQPSKSTWSTSQVAGTDKLTELGCAPGGSLCAASDSADRVTVSSDGRATWSTPALPVSGFAIARDGLSCTSDGMCLAASNLDVYAASGLSGGAGPVWSKGKKLQVSGNVEGISCASTQLCAAVDSGGDVVVSSDPTDAKPTWTVVPTAPSALESISCPSASLCVAGDSQGNVWYSVDPASSATWSEDAAVDPGRALTALTCQVDDSCLAGDSAGQVLDTSDVTQGTDAWSAPMSSGSGSAISRLACPSTGGLCAGLAGASSGPGTPVAGPSDIDSGDWSAAPDAPTDLTDVACTDAQSCLWTDTSGDLVSGSLGTAAASPSASTLAFPDTAVGVTSSTQTVTVTDSGPGTLNVSGWSLTGADIASFAVESDTCSGTSVAPGGSCAVTVAFAPGATGGQSADLQIESDDPSSPVAISLAGTGTAAATPIPSTPKPHAPKEPRPPGRARFTHAAVTGTLVDAIVLCQGKAGERCATRLRLTAHEHLRGHRLISVADVRVTVRAVSLGTGRVSLTAQHGRVVHLALNATGRRLLKQFSTLHVTLTATQTVGTRSVRTRRFHLSFKTSHHR